MAMTLAPEICGPTPPIAHDTNGAIRWGLSSPDREEWADKVTLVNNLWHCCSGAGEQSSTAMTKAAGSSPRALSAMFSLMRKASDLRLFTYSLEAKRRALGSLGKIAGIVADRIMGGSDPEAVLSAAMPAVERISNGAADETIPAHFATPVASSSKRAEYLVQSLQKGHSAPFYSHAAASSANSEDLSDLTETQRAQVQVDALFAATLVPYFYSPVMVKREDRKGRAVAAFPPCIAR